MIIFARGTISSARHFFQSISWIWKVLKLDSLQNEEALKEFDSYLFPAYFLV